MENAESMKTTLRRIGAIGDIHAEHLALEQALAFLRGEAVEAILAVGDIVDGPGDAGRCCQLLAEFGVEAVRGNHDRWALKDELRNLPDATAALDPVHRTFLEALPVTRDYATSAGPLLLCHGLAADDMNRVTPDDFGYALQSNDTLQDLLHSEEYRFVVNGHTHRRMVRQLGGLTIINVGTLFREHAPCFAIIDFEVGQADFFDAPNSGVITRADRHEL